MRLWTVALGAMALVVPGVAGAQSTLVPAAAQGVLAPAAADSMLRVGTPVALRLGEELSTKHKQLRVGQRFNLEVAEAIYVNSMMVVPVGTPAVGEVVEVRNKGMWGKSGHFSAHVLYLRINGRQIRLTGTFDEKGTTGTAGVVGAVVFVPLAGFFMTGTSAQLPVGTPVKAFIDEDIPVAPGAPQQIAPLPAVRADAPAAPVPAAVAKPCPGAGVRSAALSC